MTDSMIALVTGANKGIGREIASQLAQLGHTVIIGGRGADAGEKPLRNCARPAVTSPRSSSTSPTRSRRPLPLTPFGNDTGAWTRWSTMRVSAPARRGLRRTAPGLGERR